ncbi:MAG: sugar phosphate isomerase/epimerase [bacterium]|nr:MAG: sugar phosphate isomerase/epimerase [bacterium]
MNRRKFLETAGLGLAALHLSSLTSCARSVGAGKGATGVGICDWNLGESCDPDLIPLAKEAHLEGIQVSVGTNPDNIPLRDAAVRRKYLELGRTHGITFHSVAAGILNGIPLATEPQSAVYVIDALEAAAVLGAGNVLLAFFGRGDLRRRDSENEFIEHEEGGFKYYDLHEENVTRVVEVLRQIVPRAEDAGVIIGLENTITAKQNLQIIDRIGSPIVQVYYDVGNSWGNGYDVPGEIRMLGNNRICEVHLKDWDTSMLGNPEGMVDMKACARALEDIGYDKWLVLETSGREGRFVEDTSTNVAFVKETFQMA